MQTMPVQRYAHFLDFPNWIAPDQDEQRVPNILGGTVILFDNRSTSVINAVTILAQRPCSHGDMHNEIIALDITADGRFKCKAFPDTQRFNTDFDFIVMRFAVATTDVRIAAFTLR